MSLRHGASLGISYILYILLIIRTGLRDFVPFAVRIKEGCPSDDELEGLALRIVEEWKALGRRLNFDKSQLAGFHKDNEKCSEKAYEMLVAWKQREDTAATYTVLYEGLCHSYVSRKDLAEDICCHSD